MTFLSTLSVLPAPSSLQCPGLSTRMSDGLSTGFPFRTSNNFSKHLLQLRLHTNFECLTTLALMDKMFNDSINLMV